MPHNYSAPTCRRGMQGLTDPCPESASRCWMVVNRGRRGEGLFAPSQVRLSIIQQGKFADMRSSILSPPFHRLMLLTCEGRISNRQAPSSHQWDELFIVRTWTHNRQRWCTRYLPILVQGRQATAEPRSSRPPSYPASSAGSAVQEKL
jgi:hypothetical protein